MADEQQKQTDMQEGITGIKFSAGYDRLTETVARTSFKKPVQIIHSYPDNGEELTALDRKVLNALVMYVQETYSVLSEAHRDMILDPKIRATPIFKTTIAGLIERVDYRSKNTAPMYDSLHRLMAPVFVMNVMEDRDGVSKIVEKVYRHIITELKVGEADGLRNGEIGFEVPNGTLGMLLEPFPFAQLEMAICNGIKSSPTIALYENTYRYITTISKHTGVLPVDEWIAILSARGRYAGKYADFKRYVLLPAMELLKTTSSIPYSLELKEQFGPRKKVVALQFKLVMKDQGSLALDTPPPTWPKQLLELLRDVYGFTRTEVRELSHTGTEQEVQEACRREVAQFTRKKADGELIRDRKRYLKGVLQNLQAGKPRGSEPDYDSEDDNVEVRLKEPTMAELLQEFKNYQVRIARDKFDLLPEEDKASARSRFAADHEHSQSVQRMLTAGWDNPRPGLLPTFGHWLIEQVDWYGRLLTQENEVSFDAWSEKRFNALMQPRD